MGGAGCGRGEDAGAGDDMSKPSSLKSEPSAEAVCVLPAANTWSCFACVAAMATKTTLQDVVDYVGHDGSAILEGSGHPESRRGFRVAEIIQYLAEHGYQYGVIWAWIAQPVKLNVGCTLELSNIGIAGLPAIVHVKSARLPGCWHVVYWDGKRILDPHPDGPCVASIEDYEIFEFVPLLEIEE
jgi:hypothetical protein